MKVVSWRSHKEMHQKRLITAIADEVNGEVDFKDELMHVEKRDKWFSESGLEVDRAGVTMDDGRVLRGAKRDRVTQRETG